MGFQLHFSKSCPKDESELNDQLFNETFNALKSTCESQEHGFFRLSENDQFIKRSTEIYNKHKNIKTFIHIGIGGSALGPKMLLDALQKNKRQFIFMDNIDSDTHWASLEGVNPADTLIYIVSKSGGTAETLANMALILHWLEKHGINKEEYKNHFIFATDPVKSELLDYAKETGIECLEVPSNVGGRYCVLSPVGILPALFADINVNELLKGAELVKKFILNSDKETNNFLRLALSIFEHYKKGYSQTVFMPYSSKLKSLSSWFIQLWAESLGKKENLNGKIKHVGLTPVAAVGATDQHSSLQLFQDGPKDKFLIMMEVENFEHDYSLENNLSIPTLKKLSPFTLNQLMKAEFMGTLKAFEDENIPFVHFALQNIDETTMGALILYLESLTVAVAHLLEINPFNQPGVEAAKRHAQEWMSAHCEN
jgi:glucose-6-phosphate isomerase